MKQVCGSHVGMLPKKGNTSTPKRRIPVMANVVHHLRMSPDENRRRNLATVLVAKGIKKADLARLVGKAPPNITQLLNGGRAFGSKSARQFEEVLNLRPGYLDESYPLTDEALHLAKDFQNLNTQHRAEVKSIVLTFRSLEEHQAEAAAILPIEKQTG